MKKNEILLNSLIFSLIASILVNFALIKKTSIIIFLFIFYFAYGILVSILASKKKCKKTGKLLAVFHGILNSVSVIIIYLFLLTSKLFNKSLDVGIKRFTTVSSTKVWDAEHISTIKDTKFGKFVVFLFVMFFFNIFITIFISKESIKRTCDFCPNEIFNNLKKYNEYLDKKPDTLAQSLNIKEP